jgi:nicotinamide mononucleotide (NMN) deamidase PncC
VDAETQKGLVERVHASRKQLVLAITGGGSGTIAALLEVSGASASVLEAVVPYSANALDDWLRGRPDNYCSERTARAMAMAAFERARKLSEADSHVLRGIGATASLASNKPKRGAHRVHVAWQSFDTTAVASCELVKGQRTRAEEEHVATQLVLHAVAEACGVDLGDAVSALPCAPQRRIQKADAAWIELLLGTRTSIEIGGDEGATLPAVLFPGAFNPIHGGHIRMAEVAAAHCGSPVTFEVSITNVDKPPLDFIEIADRLEQLRGRRVLLTRAPTFIEKARLAAGCVFVVGIDTLERIGQPRYYGGDATQRDAAIEAIAKHGCQFLVFGRASGEEFLTLEDVQLPEALRALCEFVPEGEFRTDISSTQLRGG